MGSLDRGSPFCLPHVWNRLRVRESYFRALGILSLVLPANPPVVV
jgi:hypothetical protein